MFKAETPELWMSWGQSGVIHLFTRYSYTIPGGN